MQERYVYMGYHRNLRNHGYGLYPHPPDTLISSGRGTLQWVPRALLINSSRRSISFTSSSNHLMPPKPFLPPPVSESETERVRNVPALHTFLSAVDETFASGDENAFWRCESFFRALCKSGFERELINYELRRMTEGGAYSALGGSGLKLMITSRPRYSLLLMLTNPSDIADQVFSTMPEHRMLAVLGPAALELRLFKQPPSVRNEVFDPSVALLPNGDLALGPGDVATFVAGRDVIGTRHCDAPTLTLLFGSDIQQSVRWEFDPATLLPLRAIAAETTPSRLQYTAQLFTHLGGESTLPGLRRMLDHREHFVRWTALQSIMAIDPIEGAARLHEAVLDPHPHMRNAATRALVKLAEHTASTATAAE